ncbi:hypothetical protein SeLEV6574_g05132 [Synchytrium endobioticum]|uniref:Ankyrin n=1 Tax=Synchytrium endobioticum TaxID=286115 RepID=A0A507CVU6_9FUNG|nr:hypothetical protein SeLEV6574_g05132 [Synchytrium endobioticum]
MFQLSKSKLHLRGNLLSQVRRDTPTVDHIPSSVPATARSSSSRGPLSASSSVAESPTSAPRVSDYYRQAYQSSSALKRSVRKQVVVSYDNNSSDDLSDHHHQQCTSPLTSAPPSMNRCSSPRTFLLALFADDSPQFPVRLLPNMDVNMQLDNQGHTALHWAAAMGRYHLAKYLVSHGAHVCVRNTAGETPLMKASFLPTSYELSTFEHLVPLLAQSIPCQDSKRRTILHHLTLSCGSARRGGMARYYFDCLVKYLVHEPPSADIPDNDQTARHALAPNDNNDRAMCRRMIDWQDRNGDTALNLASRAKVPFVATTLLKLGASKWIQNTTGLSPVDFGVNECEHSGTFSSCMDGMAPPKQPELDAMFGKSPVFTDEDIQWEVPVTTKDPVSGDATEANANAAAASFNFNESVAYENRHIIGGLVANDELIVLTASQTLRNPNAIIDDQGHTAMHWSASLGRDNLVRLLLQIGASITSANYCGETPLIRLVRVPNSYETGSAGLIISCLASTLLSQDIHGKTALHHIAHSASILGHTASSQSYLRHVLRERPDLVAHAIHCKDLNGDTPVAIAERMGNQALVAELVAAGYAVAYPVRNIRTDERISSTNVSSNKFDKGLSRATLPVVPIFVASIQDRPTHLACIAEAADAPTRSQTNSSTNLIIDDTTKMEADIPLQSSDSAISV